jgi:uncharacterized protein (DUF1697 family)
MTTRVGFLRAVNLGRRRVDMKRLAAATVDAGFDDVWTYVNSGNVVFDGTGRRESIEGRLESAYEAEFGFECTTFVRTASELQNVLAEKPFAPASGDTYFVTFLKSSPATAQRSDLESMSNSFDTIVVRGRDVHWLMHGRSSDSPLTKRDWERILGPNSSTSRNTNMLGRLVAKLDT